MSRRPQLVLLGRQGAGKGTQAARLAKHYGVPHLSTGEIFRHAVEDRTSLGVQLAEYMESGELVPDEIVLGVVRELFDSGKVSAGYIFDGFPRTVAQGEGLEEILSELGRELDLAVDLEVPRGVVLHRLSGRRVCADCGAVYHLEAPPSRPWLCDVCGGPVVHRDDDTEEAINRRLELYEAETVPLIEMYGRQGLLVEVDGVGEPDEVFDRLVAAIDTAPLRTPR